ncbi:MAG: hypothetical protein WBP93_18945 [Pyrinomonadaceae bacterium]
MWDTKRQIIWLTVGFAFGTFIVYLDSHDDDGIFSTRFFIFMEMLLILIIITLFYIYSRKR